MNIKQINLLREWREMRESAQKNENTVQLVKSFFEDKPTVSFHTDPYTKKSWPNPWQLIYEDTYCEFTKILAICYTLQLTTKFTGQPASIYIIRDIKNHKEYPVLYIGENCICFEHFDMDENNLTKSDFMILLKDAMSPINNEE